MTEMHLNFARPLSIPAVARRRPPIWLIVLLIPLLGTACGAIIKQCFDVPQPMWGDEVGYYVWQQSWLSDFDSDPTNQIHAWDDYERPTIINGDRRVTLNKYSTGVSQMLLPFTATARAIVLLDNKFFAANLPSDGSGALDVRLAWLGSAIWSILGLLATFALARHLSAPLPAAIATATCWAGTAAFAYTSRLPIFSHGPATAALAIAAWLIVVKLDAENLAKGFSFAALLGGLFAGLVIAVRVPDVVWILPLALVLIVRAKRIGFFNAIESLGTILAGGALPLLIEIGTRKAAYGRWFFNGYAENHEAFYFGRYVLDVLFRLKIGLGAGRGALVGHPIIVIALIGLVMQIIFARGDNRTLAIGTLIATIITVLIYGSWWFWTLGYSYGARWTADPLALWTMGVALWLNRASPRWFMRCVGILAALALWSIWVSF
jgi:hypothetical protein